MRRYFPAWMLLAWIGFISLALLIAVAPGIREPAAEDARPEDGHPAPDFSLRTLEGKTVRLSDLRGKKVVLINFWATWCPPCRFEMPTMQKLYSEKKEQGFEILAVNIEPDAKKEIHEFMKELRLSFPVLLDPEMKVARKYRVFGLPASMLIDRQGVIRLRDTGYNDWTSKESRRQVESLLK